MVIALALPTRTLLSRIAGIFSRYRKIILRFIISSQILIYSYGCVSSMTQFDLVCAPSLPCRSLHTTLRGARFMVLILSRVFDQKTWRLIMSLMASQITSLTIVYSPVCSDTDQRKHQTPRHWFLWGTSPVNSPHKRPVTRKMFPFDGVIMGKLSSFLTDVLVLCLTEKWITYRRHVWTPS